MWEYVELKSIIEHLLIEETRNLEHNVAIKAKDTNELTDIKQDVGMIIGAAYFANQLVAKLANLWEELDNDD